LLPVNDGSPVAAPATGADAEPVLACTSLTKRYGERTVVDGVSFSIGAGETYGLLGPNGAGKTTTISLICGLLRSDGGTVVVAGRPIRPDNPAGKAAIGLVPQDIALYPDLTARENLAFFGRLQGLSRRRRAARSAEVLALVGLTDRADDRIETYSGGMKRRANIAAGLLHEPPLLILDEPTVGVDPQSRNAILESIEVLGGAGLSVLYTTHYMEEAERLCDRIGIIDEGRLVAEGTRADLVHGITQRTHLRVTGTGPLTDLAERAQRLDGVHTATLAGAADGTGTLDLLVDDAGRTLGPVIEQAEKAGIAIGGLDVVEPDLETVFLELTGKALRD
jgi:ABC-2 type transport system ATP-binding protein